MLSFRRSSAVLFVLILVGSLATRIDTVAAQERVVPQSAAAITLSFAPVVKAAAPSVVNVHSADTARRRATLFSPRGQVRPRGSRLGSGVVVTRDGLVVTNAHVVGEARSLLVSFNARREYSATLLQKDERTYLAVLQIDREDEFPPLPLGDGVDVEVGDLVLAIGNPFGVGQTVTQGIVSALARTQVGVSDDRFFIQTDAAINPGNSGGALVDMRGRLVGINTAIYSRSGGSNGIGFAIPSNMAKSIMSQILEFGDVRRGLLGVRIDTVGPDEAEMLGLTNVTGALVVDVSPDSAAERAGIEVNDIITAINGNKVDGAADLRNTIGLLRSGEQISVTAVRDGRAQELSATLDDQNGGAVADASQLHPGLDGAELANAQGRPGVGGSSVEPNSRAQLSGLRDGDLIIAVNRQPVEDLDELLNLAEANSSSRIFVEIERDGRRRLLSLRG